MGIERESRGVGPFHLASGGRTGLKRESPSMIPRRIGVTNIVLRVSNLCRLGLMSGVPRTDDGLNGIFPTAGSGFDRFGGGEDVGGAVLWGLSGGHAGGVLCPLPWAGGRASNRALLCWHRGVW